MVRPGDSVKCGDAQDCDECDSRESIEATVEGQRVLTANDKGRCDFYSGPKDDIQKVSVKPLYDHSNDD